MIEEKSHSLNISQIEEIKTIIWYDYNGNILTQKTYVPPLSLNNIRKYTPQPTTVYQTHDAQGTYGLGWVFHNFTGNWTMEGSENANIVFRPQYTNERAIITYYYKNYDGSILQTGQFYDGDYVPGYTGSTPVRASDDYQYTFNGWDRTLDYPNWTDTYVAKYNAAWIYAWRKYNCGITNIYVWDQYSCNASQKSESIGNTYNQFKCSGYYSTSYTISNGKYVMTYCNRMGDNVVCTPLGNMPLPIYFTDVNSISIVSHGYPVGNYLYVNNGYNTEGEVMYGISNHKSGGYYWYDRYYFSYSKNAFIQEVRVNDNANAYTNDTRNPDGYWYIRRTDKDSINYWADDSLYIGNVYSTNINSYPENGRHTDGYYYIKFK